MLVAMLMLGVAQQAQAGVIYVSDTAGNVWRYDNMADMAGQNSTTNTGTLVATHAAYAADQDVVADLNPGGLIYRITVDGDIISYANVAAYLANSNPVQVGVDNVFSGTNRINGASFDGNAPGGRFYTVGAGGMPTNPQAGDIEIYNTIATFLTGIPDSVIVAGYNGAVLNFFDPHITQGTSVGPTPTPHPVDAQYYQVAGNGRLEGFQNLTEYGANANNRVNIGPINAFGTADTTPPIDAHPYQARAAFAVVPEPASLLLCLGAACGLVAIRRR